MFAGVCEGTAAGAAVLEVSAVLIHLAEFLAHEANNFHSEHGLGSDELEEDGSSDETEAAVSFAVGAEGVGGGAQGCGESDDAARPEQAFEDFAAVVGEDGDTRKPVLNDIDAAALGALTHDDIVAKSGNWLGKRLEGLEEFWRQLERATGLRVSKQKVQWVPARNGLPVKQHKA